MENIIWKAADHSKESQLFNVEKSRKGEGASKKEDCRFRSALIQFFKAL